VREALLKGKTLYTSYGRFRVPSGLSGPDGEGQASVFSGSTPRGCIRRQGGRILADIWDVKGTWLLETFEVRMPQNTVKLQEKSHPLPKGGETTQYTITVPKNIVESLGWKKGDRLKVDFSASDSLEMSKRP
jgi:hypothetical protein